MGNIANGQQDRHPLSIKALTWHKECHQLFDYHSNNYISEDYQSLEGGFIAKLNQSVTFENQLKEGQEALVKVGEPTLSQVTVKLGSMDSENGMWVVARQGESIQLREGDRVKLGRVHFLIKEINLRKQPSTITTADVMLSDVAPGDIEDSNAHSNEDRSSTSSKLDGDSRCRICFGREVSEQDPLLNPCKCSGTLQNAHLGCLKMWILQKMQKKITPKSFCYKWSKSKCEVCQQAYQEKYLHDGRSFDLYKFEVPAEPHLVLEGSKMRNGEEKRVTFICRLENDGIIQIGRDHESEVRTNDVSVSRKHSTLLFSNGSLFIKDNKSKFGTLVRLRNRTVVPANQLWLQYGRTVVILSKEMSFTSACCMCVEDHQFQIEDNPQELK